MLNNFFSKLKDSLNTTNILNYKEEIGISYNYR